MNTLTNTRQTKMNLDALNKIDELNKLDTLFDIETNNVMDFINTKLSSNSIKFLQLVKNRINESIKQQRVVIKNEKMELKQMKLEDKKNKVVKEKKPRVVKEKKEKVVKEKKEKVVKQKKEKVVLETVEIEPENIKFEICELDEDELAEEELLTQLHYSKQDMENEQPTNEEYEIEEYKEEEEEPEEIKSEEQVKQELIDDIFGDDDEDNHFYCYECKIDYLEYEKLECADGNCCIDCGIKNRCVCYVCDYKGLLKTNLFQEQTINTVLNPPITNVIINDEPFIYGSLNDPVFEIIEEIKPLEDTYISDDTAVQDYFKSIKSGDIVDLLSNSDIVKCKFIQLRKFRVEILVINWEDADGNIKENNLNKKLIVGLAPITIIIKHKPVETIPEIKPIETIPEIKPIETIPEIKPVETIPEIKPVETIPEIKPIDEKRKRNIFIETEKAGIYKYKKIIPGLVETFWDRDEANFIELYKYNKKEENSYLYGEIFTTDKFVFYHRIKCWTITAQFIKQRQWGASKPPVNFECKFISVIDKNGIELQKFSGKLYEIKYKDIEDIRDI